MRVEWVDIAKGVGIILVVIGHTLRGLNSSGIISTNSTLYTDSWIYSFHMPLFFILAGLFITKSVNWGSFIRSKLSTVIYPYFFWSVLFGIIHSVLSKHANSPFHILDIWKIIYDPIGHFWFLYVLFICQLMFFLTNKISINLFFISAVVYWFLPAFPMDLPIGVIYQFHHSLIFFAIGVLLGTHRNQFESLPIYLHLLFSFVGFALVTFGLSSLPELILAISGSIAVMSLSVVASKTYKSRYVRTLGEFSLEIYVAHIFFSAGLRIILSKIMHFDDPLTHFALGTLFGLYGPLLLAIISRYYRFTWLFRLTLNSILFIKHDSKHSD